MIIIEQQENDITREYNLPEEQRDSWHDFFSWLVDTGEILGFEIRN
jgi:hypothetical protein